MKTEIFNQEFQWFVLQATTFIGVVIAIIVGVNYFVDASQVITSKSSREMARLVLAGNIVATPKNYNERVFQVAIVEEMDSLPETIVIGSSRGMYIGEEITSFQKLYNNCVSGACIEDYYALLGLYHNKFSSIPHCIIMEVSPWVFYEKNPLKRWLENIVYLESCKRFYRLINGYELNRKELKKENPYTSISYFQYNVASIQEKGLKAFSGESAHVSSDVSEAADYPDGTIRYVSSLENSGPERLKKVKGTNKCVTYLQVDKMKRLGQPNTEEFEKLIMYLRSKGIEIIIYMSPFSVTQCKYIYDKKMNPSFEMVERYLIEVSSKYSIKVIGSYDAKKYNLTDDYFIDFMHLDKKGTKMIWNEHFNY